MVSAGTLHVVSTELAVGAFAMAGVAFLLPKFTKDNPLIPKRVVNDS